MKLIWSTSSLVNSKIKNKFAEKTFFLNFIEKLFF